MFITGISVSDRNGSLETNESSSPETNQSDMEGRPTKMPPTNTLFDFNEFFKIENLPGIVVGIFYISCKKYLFNGYNGM